MASSSMSPGGALLRASRVFAIPSPTPAPVSAMFGSNSQTLPHPTHQTLTTPTSALRKGDWGLKRHLPIKKTTKTSTPLLRINEMDNYWQYTDYKSSADHAITLRKWQELEMPLTIPVPGGVIEKSVPGYGNYNAREIKTEDRRSVFDEEVDNIADVDQSLGAEDLRWKFKGPWIAGLSEGDFQEYIRTTVKGRKTEFREFLRRPCAERLTARARRNFLPQEEDDTNTTPHVYEASDITEQQLDDFTKSLRHDRRTLSSFIRAFLDLPPAPTAKSEFGNTIALLDKLSPSRIEEQEFQQDSGFAPSSSPYAQSGPPKTHPSAGLSYLRSSAFTPNHPVHGPRSAKNPVEARIVMPKGAAGAKRGAQPLIGVGGIVCNIPTGVHASGWELASRQGQTSVAGLLNIEPDRVGGSRAFVAPRHATVDPEGRVIMKVDAADPVAVDIKQGRAPQEPRRAYTSQPTPMGMSRSVSMGGQRSVRDYGLSRGSSPFRVAPAAVKPSTATLKADRDELDFLENM